MRPHLHIEPRVRYIHSRPIESPDKGICIAYYVEYGQCHFSLYVHHNTGTTYDKKHARRVALGRLEVGKKSEFYLTDGKPLVAQLQEAVSLFFHSRFHAGCSHPPFRLPMGSYHEGEFADEMELGGAIESVIKEMVKSGRTEGEVGNRAFFTFSSREEYQAHAHKLDPILRQRMDEEVQRLCEEGILPEKSDATRH